MHSWIQSQIPILGNFFCLTSKNRTKILKRQTTSVNKPPLKQLEFGHLLQAALPKKEVALHSCCVINILMLWEDTTQRNTTVCSSHRNMAQRASKDCSCYDLHLVICPNLALSMFIVTVLNMLLRLAAVWLTGGLQFRALQRLPTLKYWKFTKFLPSHYQFIGFITS